jgi:serine/threonine protein kinase
VTEAGTLVLGRYRLVRELGSGLRVSGAPRIWEAEDAEHEGLAARVVVKLPSLADDDVAERELLSEARLLRRVSHPGVVAVRDFGTDAATSTPYLVLDYREGRTLRALLAEHGPLEWRLASSLLAHVLDAVSAVHAAGVVHGDLKPDNVIVSPGSFNAGEGGPGRSAGVALIDFGAAHEPGALSPGASGLVFGTPEYMSPEQARGEAVDTPSDVYSAGCVLHELLTGTAPFAGETASEIVALMLTRAPPRLEVLLPAIPKELAGLARSSLAKGPAHRPSASSFRDALLMIAG